MDLMVQKEFDWNGLSLLAQVGRMLCGEVEREFLKSLVQLYRTLIDAGSTDCEYVDGHILMIVSKKQIAEVMGGCSVRTVQRRLQQLSEDAIYCRFSASGTGRPHFFDIDVSRIMNADEDPLLTEISQLSFEGTVSKLRGLQQQLISEDFTSSGTKQKITRVQNGPETTRDMSLPTRDMSPPNLGQKPETPRTNSTPLETIGNHEKPYTKSTIKTITGSLKRFRFKDLKISEFKDASRIQFRYQEAVSSGVLNKGVVDRHTFFALMIHLARQRKLKKPAGLLTSLLRGEVNKFGKTWRQRPTNKDCDQAKKMIHELDFGPDCYQRSSDLEAETEWVDESEFTDDVPLIVEREKEEKPALPASVLATLQEASDRKKRELVR